MPTNRFARAAMISPLVVVALAVTAACEDDSTFAGPQFSLDSGANDVQRVDSSTNVPLDAGVDAADATTDAAPTCTSDEALCGGACVSKTGNADQVQNATTAGRFYLTRDLEFVQTIIGGATGQLVGIELSLERSTVGAEATQGTIRLSVRDDADATIGSAELPLSTFQKVQGNYQLESTAGDGYFDLSAACIPVTTGSTYKIALELVGVPTGACELPTCTAGAVGDSCLGDAECDYQIGVEMSAGTSYGGEFTLDDNYDFIFRTYVR